MKKLLILVLALLLFGCAPAVVDDGEPSPTAEFPVTEETPTAEITDTATPLPPVEPEEVAFIFTRDNFPRLDGSTSTKPFAEAVASVLLGETREEAADLIHFNKTTMAYHNLAYGDADLIIAAEPTADLLAWVKDYSGGIEMQPFAIESLVFMVNADNPVDSLTVSELKQIYKGEITNWSQVGGHDLPIEAFQRNAHSGSQVMMEKLVLPADELMEAPASYVVGEMDGLIKAVRSFNGSANAIGYTVYYYAEDMRMAEGLKLLKIDGTPPTDATIASGEYAFLNPYYVAILSEAKAMSPERILFDWILSDEGQALVAHEGYVPVNGG